MKIKSDNPIYTQLFINWAGANSNKSFSSWLNKNKIKSRYEWKDYPKLVWNYWILNKARIQFSDGWYGFQLLFDMGEYYDPIIIVTNEKKLLELASRIK
jgi:hypothetical protein